MSSDEITYFTERAATERARGLTAPTEEIAAVHEKLAGLYIDLVARLERTQAAQDVQPLPRTQQRVPPDTLQ